MGLLAILYIMITFVTNLKLNFKIVAVMDKELIKRTYDL